MNTHKYIWIQCYSMQVNLHEEVYKRGESMKRPRESWSAFIERLMDMFEESKAEMNDGR